MITVYLTWFKIFQLLFPLQEDISMQNKHQDINIYTSKELVSLELFLCYWYIYLM